MNAIPTTATLPTANIDLPPEPRRRSRAQAAEWIGAITNALDHMPRLDTEPFLATVSGHVLKAEARRQGIKLTAVTAIRDALTDALPDWKPQFGMPGPKPTAIATMAEGDDEDV